VVPIPNQPFAPITLNAAPELFHHSCKFADWPEAACAIMGFVDAEEAWV
jgi:hypothetical protein